MQTRARTRFNCNALLSIQPSCLDKVYAAQALNYSEEGIAFETNHKFKVGTVVYIKKNLCTEAGKCRPDQPILSLSCFATVKWVCENELKSDSAYSVGVKNFTYGSFY